MWAKGVTRGTKALGQKVAGVPQDQKETHVADGEGAGREQRLLRMNEQPPVACGAWCQGCVPA